MRHKRLLVPLAQLTLLVAVGFLANGTTRTADAAVNLGSFSNRLTNRADVSAAGQQGRVDLHIKNVAGVAEVPINRVAAYFPVNQSSDRNSSRQMTLTIAPKGSTSCRIPPEARGMLLIRIVTKNTSSRVEIPIDRACSSGPNGFYDRVIQFPVDEMFFDTSTGLAKATIDVRFTGAPLRQDQMASNDSDGWSLNYNMQLSGARSTEGRLAVLGGGSNLNPNVNGAGTPTFSFRSSFANNIAATNGRRTVQAGVVFGFPCTVNVSLTSVLQRSVGVYDPDAAFGDTFLQILRDNQPLAQSEYEPPNTSTVYGWDSGQRAWRVKPGNNVWRFVSMKKTAVDLGSTYKMRLTNTGLEGANGRNSPSSPHNNTLSLYIPFDSIYGVANCQDYVLTPTTSLNRERAEEGQNVAITSTVNMSGRTTRTPATTWQVTKMVFSGTNINALKSRAADYTSQNPCAVAAYQNGSPPRESCVANWSTSPPSNRNGQDAARFVFRQSSTFTVFNYRVAPGDIGKTICFVTSVSYPRDSNNRAANQTWRHSSNLQCFVGAKQPVKPMVQLWGYDGRLGGKAVTSLTEKNNNTFGSWSEYASLSGGRNLNFASASGLNNGAASAKQSDWSKLTAANTANACNSTGMLGCYGTVGYPTNLVAALRARCTQTYTGDQTITPGMMAASKIICVNGRATIRGNIINNSGIRQQLVLIANDIIIDKDVTRIDAWLIAAASNGATGQGRISTCSEARSGVNAFPAFNQVVLRKSDACSKRLAVTGPVIADAVYLYRTTDPGTNGTPAERFNLRADAFLWAYSGGTSSADAVAQTVLIKELPPRF